MASNIGELVIYLLAGMQVKIKAPVKAILGRGWFPSSESQIIHGSTSPREDIVNGFIVEDPEIGTIESVSNEVAVIYTHKKPLENRIWFFADTGEMAVCVVAAVPIHDHSSVVQGGPAYGTYFSDDQAL